MGRKGLGGSQLEKGKGLQVTTYNDFAVKGDISEAEARRMTAARNRGNAILDALIKSNPTTADALAFGILDAMAVRFVRWFGAAQTAEVFRHYATVCAAQADKDNGEGVANG